MALHPLAGIGKSARMIARNFKPGPVPGPGRRVARPYTRAPKAVLRPPRAPVGSYSSPLASLRTLTPTVTGTGVTTASGPGMPGAPGPQIKPPKVGRPINFNTADPNDVVQAEQAPEYAAINSAEHQDQLMGAAQLQAIQSGALGLSAFIKKEGGTLGQDYVAALALQSGRNNTYQQYLVAQKYADARLEVAAKAPTLYNQELARRDGLKAQKLADKYRMLDQELKVQALNLQAKAYGLSSYKAKASVRQGDVRNRQSQQRIAQSAQRIKNQAAQFNAKQVDAASKIDVTASRASGQWVNSFGQPLANVPFKNPPPPTNKPSNKTTGGVPEGAIGKATTLAKSLYQGKTSSSGNPILGGGSTTSRAPRSRASRQVAAMLKAYAPGISPMRLYRLTNQILKSAGYGPPVPRPSYSGPR
jgi:hypothetical protein